ncbi:putative acyl-CoA oxidase [Tothia fuscella]|uniref:Acyl-CoA oxidase n=1 Tax=Tothia fuscella TaxID=1048955 RepID=A0A9P4NJ55_9PEZI|nr:putative acyl-CoA oxidase [Tothia fuscella]
MIETLSTPPTRPMSKVVAVAESNPTQTISLPSYEHLQPESKSLPPLEFLLKQRVWKLEAPHTELPRAEDVRIHYDRARSLCQAINMTVDDIVNMTTKFWDFHSNYIASRDGAAFTILTIHWNLCMGTLARFVSQRPDLKPLLADLQKFNVCGEFMLTEAGHGLDARNIETTATHQADGSYDLHTVNEGASKIMPPTTPQAGIARVAIVFARLIVDDEDRGVKPFLVHLNDKHCMRPGITSKPLPKRPGSHRVDHAVTYFDHVHLDSTALLGSSTKVDNQRHEFFDLISQVSVGTLSLSISNIMCLKLCSYIAGKYSLRREVSFGNGGLRIPIMMFRTQHRPILDALACASVFDAYKDWAIEKFVALKGDEKVQHGVACSFKACVIEATQGILGELMDRCGWQGLMEYNQISMNLLSQRGNSIAEGDVLVLSIRLAMEILLGKYTLPQPTNPDSLLAQHEAGLIREAKAKMASLSDDHREIAWNCHILPRCKLIVQSIGQRMAYEAAVASGTVDRRLINLYESSCIMKDLSWYVENNGMNRAEMLDTDEAAVSAVMDDVEDLIDAAGAGRWAHAPIISEKGWKTFVGELPKFEGPRNTPTTINTWKNALSPTRPPLFRDDSGIDCRISDDSSSYCC